MATRGQFEKVDVYSTWAGLSPTLLGTLLPEDFSDARVRRTTAGAATFSGTVNRRPPVSPSLTAQHLLIQPGRVLRVQRRVSGTVREWEEFKVQHDSTQKRTGRKTFEATGFLGATAELGHIEQADADGTVLSTFSAPGLSVTQHMTTYILGTLTRYGLTNVVIGYIAFTDLLDIEYDGDDPWSGLQKIVASIPGGAEPRVSWNGSAYAIDVVPQIGVPVVGGLTITDEAGADITDEAGDPLLIEADSVLDDLGPFGEARVSVNAEIDRTRTRLTQGNVIQPRGEGGATPGEATWQVVTITPGTGTIGTILLADPDGGDGPLGALNQFVGGYLRSVLGTLTLITASDLTNQTVTVADRTLFTVGQRVQIRTDSAGRKVSELIDAAAVAIDGRVAKALERSDIPATANLAPNPVGRTWTTPSTVPDTWNVIGSATVTRTTTAGFTKYGPASAQVVTAGNGNGIASPDIPVYPTALKPYLSLFFVVRLELGNARVELVLSDGVTSWVSPATGLISRRGEFVEIGIAGEDIFADSVTSVRLRLVQDGTTAMTAYVAAVQATNTAGFEGFFEGNGPRLLHQAGNAALAISKAVQVSYRTTLIDLERVDPVGMAHLQVILGTSLRLYDEEEDTTDAVRVLEADENLKVDGDTSLVLSTRPEDIASLFTALASAPRRGLAIDAVSTTAISLARYVDDMVTTAASANATSATAGFTDADVGKTAWVFGALTSKRILKTTIAAVINATTVTLGTTASLSGTGLTMIYGASDEVLTLAGGIGGSRAGNALVDQDGRLALGLLDQQGRNLDTFYAKALVAEPDDLDSVDDGVNRVILPPLLDLAVTQPSATGTTVTLGAVASDPTGGAAPAIAVSPMTGVTNNGDGTWTIARPASGAGPGFHTFTATKTLRTARSVVVMVQEQAPAGAAAGPSLTVQATPGSANYTINYSGVGTLTLSIDGAAFAAPPASPITVTRGAAGTAGKVYAFKSVGADGSIITNSVTIPSLDQDTVTPNLTVTPGTQTSTTQPFTVTGSNPSGGAAPTLTVTLYGTTGSGNTVGAIAAATPTTVPSGEIVTVNRPAFNTVPATAEFKAVISGGGTEIIQRTITNQDKTAFGPNLDVRMVLAATTATITWTGTSVDVSIDGAAYGAPAASPITVGRNSSGGADKVYAFRSIADSRTMTNAVIIPAIAAVDTDTNTVTPDLSIVPGTMTATTELYTVTASNPGGGAAPSVAVTLYGTTGSASTSGAISAGVEKAINSGEVVTINRPAFAAVPATTAFKAVISGGGTEIIAFNILNQDKTAFGPSGDVTMVESATVCTFTYSGIVGTFDYKIDNAAYGAVPASGFTVARNAAGGVAKIVTFRLVVDGQTITQSFTVAQKVSGTVPPSIDAFSSAAFNVTNNNAVLTWIASNEPAGVTYDLLWESNASWDDGTQKTITGVTSPYTFEADTLADTDIVAKGTSGYESITFTFLLLMKNSSSVVVADKTCTRGASGLDLP